jgi:hypothetical protein
LHAHYLHLHHPITHEPLQLEAPLPPALALPLSSPACPVPSSSYAES